MADDAESSASELSESASPPAAQEQTSQPEPTASRLLFTSSYSLFAPPTRTRQRCRRCKQAINVAVGL